MIITNKYIFIHIPKSAGNSVRDALQGGDWKKKESPPYRGHITLSELMGHVGKETINSRFKFAFVRNPWDRTLSLYSHYTQKGIESKKSTHEYVKWKKQGFNPWVINTLEHLHAHIRWGNDHLLQQQVAWLIPKMDFIGRFEHLIEDFGEICKHIKHETNIKHNRRTATHHKSYKDIYTKEARDKVAEVFAEDIKFFGFTFDSTATKNVGIIKENWR